MSVATGSRLGPYEVLEAIGSGGMGDVYRARDTRLGRLVAIKVLPPALAEDPTLLERFQREARAVAALSHPNILSLHDFGASNGNHFAVTELLRGRTVRERLRDAPMPLREALDTALQVAEGLAAAHERGIIHRDLKPENVFVQDDGRVKLLDFGLARFVPLRHVSAPSNPALTPPSGTRLVASDGADGVEPTISVRLGSSSVVVGSIGYMSPEQAQARDVDARSDVFAFGTLLYEMSTGRRAFPGSRQGGRLLAVLDEEPASPSSQRPEIPVDLERTIMRCLEKAPERRFPSVRDLALDLTAVLAHEDFDRRAGSGPGAPTATLTLSDALGLTLPPAACRALGLAPGQRVDLHLHPDRMELRPRKARIL